MRKSNVFFGAILLMLIVFTSYADAAIIRGNLYDISLNRINDVVVEINSTPRQTWVSKDGSYAFSLSQGSYKIQAYQKSGQNILAKADETIDITKEGDFFVDLILFPELGQGSIDEVSPGVNLNTEKNNDLLFIYIVAAMILFFAIGLLIRFFNAKKHSNKTTKISKRNQKNKSEKEDKQKVKNEQDKKSEDLEIDVHDSNKIIEILKKSGGRSTQKDIRKEIPLSEAKISLMIAELENKGKIKKIKKGRGNIIILNK